jgi:predicted dehydrogenase
MEYHAFQLMKVISMEEKYNVALVGCGVIAQTHLQALKGIDNLKIVAVCDVDKNKAKTTSEEWNIDHYYTDLSKLLDEENISILSILTPPSFHAPIAVEAIKHGVNVLVEKPLTMTTKEAGLIMDALRNSTAKMTVVYHFLFSKAMLEALALIRAQEIGEVIGAEVMMIQNQSLDPMASDPNHWSHKIFGGRLGELLPHPVYVLQSILGNDLETKKVFLSKRGSLSWMPYDELNAVLDNEKGLGTIHVSLNAPRVMETCNVYGTKKVLNIDLLRQMVIQKGSLGTGKFSVAKDSLAEACRLSLLTTRNAFQYSFRKHGAYGVSQVYKMFADSIKNNCEPVVTPEMAYNTVKIVEEICTEINKN